MTEVHFDKSLKGESQIGQLSILNIVVPTIVKLYNFVYSVSLLIKFYVTMYQSYSNTTSIHRYLSF